ncbi:xylulokinase [Oscillatoria sp. FACHB-1407]|uniref:xylulokinase n=1 Tax=Oscillatoria sp. FACHB-1407 TaxID=2692847 RepID=UPI00168A1D53|nr:xylulokinase [Oscillatoria sp. FACHB-1407]MBD2463239.1 xylulokinase [Oscillatoria sp. FACHB-1407]
MLLGIDLGTGSAKAIALDIQGQVVAESSHAYSVHAPQPGWAESNPEDWWNGVAIAVRAVVQAWGEPIQAIGLSGQMHGVVLTDEVGEPLHSAILWADTRSSEVLSQYRELSLELQQTLANPIAAGMAGGTLLWLRQHEPELYTTARWALQPKDWLRLRLTGGVATEPSDASGTLLYDVMADDWAGAVMKALNLRSDWLPELRPSGAIAETLTSDAANHLGLSVGIPVTVGAADTAAAALGSGLTSPGVVQLTVGSGAQLITLQDQPQPDPQHRTHLFRSALPDQWYTLAAIQNAGLALEWVRHLLGFTWAEVYEQAFAVPPGCEGLTFLPYLTGDRTPHLDSSRRGSWVGLGLHHTRAHLMRAALEGVAFSIRQGLEVMPLHPAEIRLAGGGTLEPSWRQLLADVLQVPLRPVDSPAASARGAALLAGLGVGIYSSVNELPTVSLSSSLITPNSWDANLDAAWQRFAAASND